MILLTAEIGDYVGRTSDLLMIDGASLTREQQLSQVLALPGNSGALITGIEKLSQRFLLELLTELGSLRYLPSRGCLFLIEARQGLWRSAGDVIASFNSSLLLVKRNLMADELDTDPDDERFGEAELESVSMTHDLAVLRVNLTSLAGETRKIIYPLRVSNL